MLDERVPGHAMIWLNVDEAAYEAMFASELQQSDAPTPDEVVEVINRTVRRLGIAGCVERMAQEFGDHPEAAAERLRWVRRLAHELFAVGGERQADGPIRRLELAADPAADLARLRAAEEGRG
jgi:hypothetical protein